jgi:hypothetical protein
LSVSTFGTNEPGPKEKVILAISPLNKGAEVFPTINSTYSNKKS